MLANIPIAALPESAATSSLLTHVMEPANPARRLKVLSSLAECVPAAVSCGDVHRVLRMMCARDERRIGYPTDTRVVVQLSVAFGRNTIVRDRNRNGFLEAP